MKKILFLVALLINLHTHSQKLKSMTGEYYLEDEREVASGFRLNADKTFDFFFSSGGIDRTGKGVWALSGDSVILNTPEKPLKNFRLISSQKTADDSITIKIIDKNKMILRYVHYRVKTEDGTIEGTTNDEGIATIKKTPLSTISLFHELWPDKEAAVFEITDEQNNYFEFGIEKWITDLTFNNLQLAVKGKDLTGGHPLMPDGKFTYKRK